MFGSESTNQRQAALRAISSAMADMDTVVADTLVERAREMANPGAHNELSPSDIIIYHTPAGTVAMDLSVR